MELRIFTEPQEGATYDDLLAVASKTEELCFDAGATRLYLQVMDLSDLEHLELIADQVVRADIGDLLRAVDG